MHNQRGLTLVEILGGIVLLGIASTLGTMILVQIFHNNEEASERIALKQDANLMVAQLNNAFHETKDDPICLDTQVNEVKVLPQSYVENNNGEIDENGCLTGFTREKPVKLNLAVGNDRQDRIDLETTLVIGGQDLNLVAKPVEDNGDPCLEDLSIEWKKVKYLPCNESGSFIWTGDKLESGCSKFSFDNLKVLDDVELKGIHIEVAQRAFFKDEVEFKDNSTLRAGHGCFSDQVDVKDNSSINIAGSATFKEQVEIEDHSPLSIGRNAAFNDEFDMKGADMKIGGTAIFRDDVDFDNGAFTIGEDAKFYDQAEFENSDATFHGNVIFHNQFDFKNKEFVVDKSSTFLGQATFKDANMTVGESASFAKQFKFENGKFDIRFDGTFKDQADLKNTVGVINGKARFGNEFEMDSSSLVVASDFEQFQSDTQIKNSMLKVYGKAAFVKNVQLSGGNSKLCVQRGISGISQHSSKGCTYSS